MGTVGQGVWRHLSDNYAELSRKLGGEYELAIACVKNISRPRDVEIPADKLTTNPQDVVSNPDIDIVCELMGGVEEAYELSKTAIQNGKIVVTANKAMLAEKGAELFSIIDKPGCDAEIYFEASVAGGIPVIKALSEGLVANSISRMYGILNGTCNYILTRMERENAPYESILADARRLGYVEADESLDLDGIDAAHKAAVLTYLAYGKWVKLEEMTVDGIRRVNLIDMRWAREFNYRIKLIASVRKDAASNRISVGVYPALVPLTDVVANVNEVFNAVAIDGDLVGRTVYIGRGAGQNATASAVIADIADAFETLNSKPVRPYLPLLSAMEMMPQSDVVNSFYVRFPVKDETGTLAEIASVFAEHKISIELLEQKKHENNADAWLIMTTHKTNELAIKNACESLEKLSPVLDKPFVLRILDSE